MHIMNANLGLTFIFLYFIVSYRIERHGTYESGWRNVVPLSSQSGAKTLWAAAQHSSSELGSTFALHHSCNCNQSSLQPQTLTL